LKPAGKLCRIERGQHLVRHRVARRQARARRSLRQQPIRVLPLREQTNLTLISETTGTSTYLQLFYLPLFASMLSYLLIFPLQS